MNEEGSFDRPLTSEEAEIVNRLSAENLHDIDDKLKSYVSDSYGKVAMIVGAAMGHFSDRFPDIPDIFFAQRLQTIIDREGFEVAGDRRRMRYCEVRRP